MSSPTAGLYGSDIGANMVRAATAELIGTFALIFTGTAVAVSGALGRSIAGSPVDSLAVGLAFGLVLVALVSALGHVSGAHLNPAVTLALAVTRKFPWRFAPAYLVAQIVGAVLASLAVWGVFGSAARDQAALGATVPATGAGIGQVLLVEVLITFLLMLVIISVATDERVAPAAVGPAVGFALAAAVLIGGPVSGGAVNPARALGPEIVSGTFTAFWAYLVGPIVGAVLAAVVYDRFLAQASAPDPDPQPE
ncbi:aquaporin [Actinomycetospora corticicola]|uniref:MIP family channel proteins n=1 Tax=Actinomycetospora corticicola TaxID=663602 RepID=A0A7Y9E2N2_9PSEU|nr:MIP family channel protein [Actinomycetospora corticicola]NYD39841.1 MIP family channel proteins [Actinomycetospora corticicola]